MMFKLLSTIIVSTLVFVNAEAQYKYRQRLSSFSTIAFPDSPKVKRVKDLDIYFTNYHSVLFMAQASHLRSGLKDLFDNHNTDSIYNSYIKGTIGSTKGRLFYKNKIAINDHNCVEFGYKATFNGQEIYRYNRAAFVNDTILVCSIWAADSLSKDDPALRPFFDGFKLKSVGEVRKAKTYNNAFKLGEKIGYILSFIIVGFIGLGIVFILKRIIYGKKSKTNPHTEFDN